ncbi:uncharacterized protein E0L32_010023 [Thyridium curvatum]|uniref:FHA domain-containing protein n=1 Tax=Thyridium curvatum TaxID=1093900 RepID=A0A507APA5_9PEZI|nr:uncharacterized protein E0L32_010023 [Thyridium curvatum]TPX08536.1 hypothetical protein E0L32_010023 [Thyridium curvatum]
MDSSPGSKATEPTLPSTAGVKRPAPSLLPPFEPLSSSPGLPRPLKRQARAGSLGANAYLKYPTPVPTSSTGILSSSPPRVRARPALARAPSNTTERAPLSAVPSIELNENGETLLMGRSSNSSHYQLSANRLISRVHVKARYIPASSPLELNKVEIMCNGWNGLKLHCQGRTWELAKGDTFTSETENAEIMMDVQDARVRIHWPKKERQESLANLSDSSWDDSPRAPRTTGNTGGSGLLQSSPLRRNTRIASPESPTPANNSHGSAASLHALLPDTRENSPGAQIQIYEDGSADEQELPKQVEQDPGTSFMTEITNSFSSDLSDLQSSEEDENDPNEENDPIIHSFGPFGANLSNRLASFSTLSPNVRHSPTSRNVSHGHDPSTIVAASTTRALASVLESDDPPSKPTSDSSKPTPIPEPAPAVVIPAHISVPTITNHLVNQLAFSRLSSVPLSAIMHNLPAEEKRDLSKDCLRHIIETTDCVGIIPRQGKDAAGKALESEYYYVPERDGDESRRAAVVDGLRKPSLRNCRKQHKQYYWKKPRTP